MALDATRLSGALQSAIGAIIEIGNEDQLEAFCDAVAESVVDEITNNAEVSVTGVETGAGTASGTVS